MSIIDQIQILINILEQYYTKNVVQDQFGSCQSEGCTQFAKKVEEEFETVKSLISKAMRLLNASRLEIEDCKHRYIETQAEMEARSQQVNNKTYEINKLNEKIVHIQQAEEAVKEQINHLQEVMAAKQKQLQLKQEKSMEQFNQVKEENKLLNQYIENMCIKYKNLEIIIDSEAKIKDKLETDLLLLTNREANYEKTVNDLHQQYCQEVAAKQYILAQLQQKQDRIAQLLSQAAEKYHEYGICEQEESAFQTENGLINEMTLDQKLIMLSDQILYQQKEYVHLNSRKNSQSSSIDNESARYRSSPIANQERLNLALAIKEKSSHQVVSQMRRACSTKQLSCVRNSQTNQNQPTPQAKQNGFGAKRIQQTNHHFLARIKDRAQARLADFYLQNSNKIIIETQGTERQLETDMSMIQEEQKAKATCIQSADPYYIHYLLTVQAIKIEEDEEGTFGILEIDMRPYYEEIIRSKIALPRWSEWIRIKLLEIYDQTQEVD